LTLYLAGYIALASMVPDFLQTNKKLPLGYPK